jgi:hypothetical protein
MRCRRNEWQSDMFPIDFGGDTGSYDAERVLGNEAVAVWATKARPGRPSSRFQRQITNNKLGKFGRGDWQSWRVLRGRDFRMK